MKKLYVFIRKVGHPILWLGLAVSLYGNQHYRDRLYWETPSIPFQPFCDPKDHYFGVVLRPIQGIKISDQYLWTVAREMAKRGLVVRIQDPNEYKVRVEDYGTLVTGNEGTVELHEKLAVKSNVPPILLTPKDYKDSTLLRHITDDAYQEVHGYPGLTKRIEGRENSFTTMNCEDIEGVIKEF